MLQRKTVNNFSKGLITEAGELTFPENATVDELNCTLERDGSKRRRLGVNIEQGYTKRSAPKSSITSLHVWNNVGNNASLTYVVAQHDSILYFYEVTPNQPLSNGLLADTIDLSAFLAPNHTSVSSEVDTTVINGQLVVVQKDINPVLVAPDLTASEITIRVRDFKWLGDKKTYFNPIAISSTTDQRKYDTQNCGWSGTGGSTALSTYTGAKNQYPPLTLPWFSGKDSTGNFSVAEWEKVYFGTTLIANGHYILDLWDKKRSLVSGLSTTLDTVEESRFSCVATFSGRVFYSGINNSTDDNGSKIFFSRVIVDNIEDIGNCYQQNDPTAEDLSDLLDTDGGFIHIAEAQDIKALHVMGPYLIVFAANGVWRISGVDDVFRASDFVVSRLSNVGLEYRNSLAKADIRPYWWSKYGIHTLQMSQQGILKEVNISLNTIQSYWLDIEDKTNVKTSYDGVNKRVYWFYGTNDKKHNVLIFDENLGAFHPWRISDKRGFLSPSVQDVIFVREQGRVPEEIPVVDLSNNPVENSTGSSVMTTEQALLQFKPELFMLTYDTDGYTFSTFNSIEFKDWGSEDYLSFLESSYDFQGDLVTKKSIMYLVSLFRRTERGWKLNEYGQFELSGASSCLVSAIWDFRDKTSSKQQAYRLDKTQTPVLPDLKLDIDRSVVESRLRILGRGSSLRLRWESTGSNDFHLLGYELLVMKNDRP